jgi:tripartite ATP-independent transporter DctM subunit
MAAGLLLGIASGFPLGLVLGGVAMVVGVVAWGPQVFSMFYDRLFGVVKEYTFLAVPLFIFMGIMVERSGISDKLFSALHIWLGGFRGGLAIGTVLLGTILAACVGVIAASVTMLGLIALPAMLSRGYGKELSTGACCAGGSLGILIPPSIMLILYGPMATISVGKLFMAAFIPGFVLSGLYCIYIAIRCLIRPHEGPALPASERALPWSKKINMLLTSMVPPIFLILAVLGTIFLGIASPTEAAAVGALASILLAAAYRSLNLRVVKETAYRTMGTFSMVFVIVVGASFFTGVFLRMGCGDVVANLITAMPGGKWGSFLIIMFIIFILGMFIDWIGIIMIMIPIVSPIVVDLGFDPLWFAMMIIVNLQMSFLSPPFAYAIFFLKGVTTPEMGIDSSHIIRGVIPFIGLIAIGLVLLIKFPQLILWLPSMMIK